MVLLLLNFPLFKGLSLRDAGAVQDGFQQSPSGSSRGSLTDSWLGFSRQAHGPASSYCLCGEQVLRPSLDGAFDVAPDDPGQRDNPGDHSDNSPCGWSRSDGRQDDVSHLHVQEIERVCQPADGHDQAVGEREPPKTGGKEDDRDRHEADQHHNGMVECASGVWGEANELVQRLEHRCPDR